MTTTLRNTGIEPVGEMPWGPTRSLLRDRDDRWRPCSPLQGGLESRRVLCVGRPSPSREEVWQALDRVSRLTVRPDQRSEVLKARDVYLAGGEINLHRSLQLERAARAGAGRRYQGIR